MKICPNCKKVYTDDYSFCNTCGCTLILQKKTSSSKQVILAIILVSIIAIVGIGLAISEQKELNKTKSEIEDYKYKKAVDEYLSTPKTSDLRVNQDWTEEKKGNYIYINGSVTNISTTKTISYYAVEAKFYDIHGKIIDSDWTNDADDLAPGETRQFEIMHKFNADTDNIILYIKEVR